MSSTQIICPKCRSKLNKPPQLEVLGEVQRSGGGFIAFGDPNSSLTCPACGAQLKLADIAAGKFDVIPPSSGVWGGIVLLIVVGLGLYQCFN